VAAGGDNIATISAWRHGVARQNLKAYRGMAAAAAGEQSGVAESGVGENGETASAGGKIGVSNNMASKAAAL